MKTRAVTASALLLLGGLLPSCNSTFDNPFANETRTNPPRATSAVLFSSNLATQVGAPREVFAIDADGANLTQLTFCGTDESPCDNAEVSPAPDRQRVMVRRRQDENGNGRFDDNEGTALVFVDLTRGAQAAIVPSQGNVASLDWADTGDVIVYSAAGSATLEDLYRIDPNGQNNRNLTSTAAVRERRLRVDPTASAAVFERLDATGKAGVYLFIDSLRQNRLSNGGPGTDPLPGTPYVVGSDTDPDFSPDGTSVVFRRLLGTGVRGLGSWSLVVVPSNGTLTERVLTTGEAFRGAPDWGPNGIVYEEVDAGGVHSLVVIQPDGGGRRVLHTGGGFDLSSPRWLAAPGG
jgi:Tol biopolymer transport system component